MSVTILNEFKALSTAEKVQLLEDLWDIVVETSEDIGLTPAQREELERRMDEYEANPNEGITFEELKVRVLGAQ